jgi:hypothetical protein
MSERNWRIEYLPNRKWNSDFVAKMILIRKRLLILSLWQKNQSLLWTEMYLTWLPLSQDPTSLDSSFLGYVKEVVYQAQSHKIYKYLRQVVYVVARLTGRTKCKMLLSHCLKVLNNVHRTFNDFKSYCKITLYSDMFRWQPPQSSGKVHIVTWNTLWKTPFYNGGMYGLYCWKLWDNNLIINARYK